jgi:hypothetical protein
MEALPYFTMALCTTSNPRSDATKQMTERMMAVSTCSMPNNRYCNADIEDEKKTMNEQVAAVICTEK